MSTEPRAATAVVTPGAHTRFVVAVLRASGASSADAEVVAEGLLWADLHGRHTNGLTRLANTVERLSKGLIVSPAPMAWEARAPAAHLLDAAHGLGNVAARLATLRSVELARAQGVGLVAVRHSNHFGAAAYFCDLAAEAGCLSFNFTNAFPKVAAHGGTRPVLGTNPLAFGCPTRSGAPILVDLSTSAISGADVRDKTGRGGRLPLDVALDAAGHPTDDPAALKTGCLLPAAGPKGFALALMVEVLSGVLTGSAVGQQVGSLFYTWDRPVDVGHLFIAVDVERFLPRDVFLSRLEGLLESLAASPVPEGAEPVRYPGEIRARSAERHRREGIPVPRELMAALERLARDHGVSVPWPTAGAGAESP